MRFSRLFGKTLREIPSEAETASHRLLLRAGLIHQVAAGIYSYLPLGLRAISKIETIIRQEMDTTGAQELLMPALQPLEIWEQTGRAEAFGDNLFRLKDRRHRDLVIAPTHEEVVTNLVKHFVTSYRDLPVTLYQIQTKFRDEARPRAGLIRVREFAMKDAYSFDPDEETLDESYNRMLEAYQRIFQRCGLSVMVVEADSGAIGGKDSQEFILPASSGEDTVIFCPDCNYAANAERAQGIKPSPDIEFERPLEEVYTPGIKTIAELSEYLGVTPINTLKAVFYISDGNLVLVSIRGDLEVNEIKLKNALKVNELRLATSQEVTMGGFIPGAASALDLKDVRSVADESIRLGCNFVVGGNRPDYHLKNANHPRDFQPAHIIDIAMAEEGQGCPRCAGVLKSTRGIEVGHIFKLGTFFTDSAGATYVDHEGHQRSVTMGCYGIGIGRLLGAAIEQNHDDRGIIFSPAIAPYQVHLVGLQSNRTAVREGAEAIERVFQESGVDVLYDDRDESPGAKLNDADLLGLPIRVVVSERSLQTNMVEIKLRNSDTSSLIPIEQVVSTVKNILEEW
jgi:prolyl-tRNA synthetase